jgi:TetR/AcrR family transcriptional regulator, transcriptional repressor for nem operon
MSKSNSAPHSETAQRIVEIAMDLIQTRGFSAISYQDIADRLAIRKASIHYHFPSKTNLGVTVIQVYSAALRAHLDAVGNEDGLTTVAMFERYCEPFRQLADTSDKVCLCGALAGEILALPEGMQPVVRDFFAMHERWLEHMLERGIKRGEVRLNIDAARAARAIFSALQGALLVRRTADDDNQLEDVIATITAQFLQPAGQRAT